MRTPTAAMEGRIIFTMSTLCSIEDWAVGHISRSSSASPTATTKLRHAARLDEDLPGLGLGNGCLHWG